MATLPTDGGDYNAWGTELNTYLSVSHDSGGKIKNGAEQTSSTAPTADAQLANKKYVDDQCDAHITEAGTIQSDGSTVFNTTMTAANTFQDLDLSAKVGSNNALAFLEIKGSAASAYAAKPKGYGTATFANHYNTAGYGTGTSSFHCQVANNYCYMIIATDSSGVIQHGANSNTTTFTVKLVGYIK